MKSNKLGIISSIFASLCCVGPLLAVSLGLGGAGLAAFFGRYHWVWLGIASAILTVGWIRYKKEKACDTGCDVKASRRTRNVLLGASVVLAVFLAMNVKTWVIQPGAQVTERKTAGEVAVIGVEGMTCFTCEVALESQLGKLAGILSVDANARAADVTVRFDPGRISIPDIKQKINTTGYRVANSKEVNP